MWWHFHFDYDTFNFILIQKCICEWLEIHWRVFFEQSLWVQFQFDFVSNVSSNDLMPLLNLALSEKNVDMDFRPHMAPRGTLSWHIEVYQNITSWGKTFSNAFFLKVNSCVLIQSSLQYFSSCPGLGCHKQLSRAGTNNYIPQIPWEVITYALDTCFKR